MFRIINLLSLSVLAYSFRDSKIFALLNLRHLLSWPIRLETLKVSPY